MRRALGIVAVIAFAAWQGWPVPASVSSADAEIAALPERGGFERPPSARDRHAIERAAIGVSAFSLHGLPRPAAPPAPRVELGTYVAIAHPQPVPEAAPALSLMLAAAALVAARRLRQRRAR